MSKQEMATVPKYLPIEAPQMPALPVWDDHLASYLELATSFKCDDAKDFELAKSLRGDGTKLRGDIISSFAEPKRIIDQIKQPFLDRENGYLALLKPAIANIDATATAWKTQQDRIAQAKAEIARREEIERREAARQEEIKRLGAERSLAETLRLRSKVADEWDGTVDTLPDLPPVIVPEIVEPRRVTIESEFKSARGVRNKPKLVVRVVDPDAVGRAYCSPDPIRYTASIKAALAVMQEPTAEQLKALEDKIGGIQIFFE